MTLKADVKKLTPGARIDLYILDLNSIGVGATYYFYPGTDENYGDVIFQGQTYTPFPVMTEGFKKQGTGSEARPKLKVANVSGFITALAENYDDLVGAEVTRRRTLGQYLDVSGGSSQPISAELYTDELYIVEQKTSENPLSVEFELASAMDFIDVKLPGRIAVANACPWQYKSTSNGSGCSWPGTNSALWFDRNGDPVGSAALDVCGKKLSDCKLRFGAVGTLELDYGGFPSLGRT